MSKGPYEKPELRYLGLLRELTRFSGFSGGNGQGGNNNGQGGNNNGQGGNNNH